jgi:hypothetical protein
VKKTSLIISQKRKSGENQKPNFDNDATNGVYHEIDNILVYNKELDNELSAKRLRFVLQAFSLSSPTII